MGLRGREGRRRVHPNIGEIGDFGRFFSEISGSFAVKSPKKHWGAEAETLWGKCMKIPFAGQLEW
jgi:hypothetical protein